MNTQKDNEKALGATAEKSARIKRCTNCDAIIKTARNMCLSCERQEHDQKQLKKAYPDWSVNNPRGAHASYAYKAASKIAHQILEDETASDNERALADCVIALQRSLLPTWVQIGGV